jgi:hypothetical protein
LVYCAESVDQDPAVSLETIAVDPATVPVHRPLPALGPDAVALDLPASVEATPETDWPYGRQAAADRRTTGLTLVPYHLRANRGPAAMRVWLPTE